MELTFMTGGMVFFAVKLFAAVLFAKLVYDMLVHKKFQVWRIFGLVSLSIIILAPSVIRPKQEIVVPTTIEQKQYQSSNEELVIETPEPRTKKLEGFKPMGEN